jgi:hypothetical protein
MLTPAALFGVLGVLGVLGVRGLLDLEVMVL